MTGSTTGTLLGVWAHPDDEAYLSAGLMAAARRRGDRVVVVTATLGEHGTDDAERWPPRRLAPVRRRELRRALAAVGVHESLVLGLPDGGCAAADISRQVDRIGDVVDAVRPDTIVTFGPDGMTGHPDHCAVSAWTTAAWVRTGGAARLWYATLTPAFHERWGALNDRLGLWSYTDAPPCTAEDELAHAAVLDDDLLDRKVAALRAHASQTEGLERLVGADDFRRWWSTEWFVDARDVRVSAPHPAIARGAA